MESHYPRHSFTYTFVCFVSFNLWLHGFYMHLLYISFFYVSGKHFVMLVLMGSILINFTTIIITEGCMLLMASLPAMDTVTDTCPVAHQNGTAHRESADTRPAAVVLRLHLYHTNQGVADGSFLSYPPGDYVAEELCIDAAKACSEYSRCASLHKEPPFMFFFCNLEHRSQDKVIKRPQ